MSYYYWWQIFFSFIIRFYLCWALIWNIGSVFCIVVFIYSIYSLIDIFSSLWRLRRVVVMGNFILKSVSFIKLLQVIFRKIHLHIHTFTNLGVWTNLYRNTLLFRILAQWMCYSVWKLGSLIMMQTGMWSRTNHIQKCHTFMHQRINFRSYNTSSLLNILLKPITLNEPLLYLHTIQ